MQFNSFTFILLFLPITVVMYFVGSKIRPLFGKIILIVASVIFYAYKDWTIFAMLGISMLVNFMAAMLMKKFEKFSKFFMLLPIIINVVLLFYFKYWNFFITTSGQVLGKECAIKEMIQPIGISFFTFQQIAYIVAVYNEEIEKISLIDYLLYILYFPKILMGPLMDPVDFSQQINNSSLKKIKWDNIACGVKIFSLGLFKKVMLADVFAVGVAWGFSNVDNATAMDWILVMLFYTLEIYFDFSGYSDMAIGVSQMLNIELPINFDSPYKALSIRDFWKRWHISLTKFFTKYIYIPLGGSRKGMRLTCVNTMVVFLISGLWHGANWTFLLWGALHGIFMIIDRIFEKKEDEVFLPVRWILTYGIINVLWLLFRADNIGQWLAILRTVLKMQNTMISDGLINCFILQETCFLTEILHLQWSNVIRGFWMFVYLIFAMGICLIPENNCKNCDKMSVGTMVLAAIAFVWGLICLSSESVFVYFNF